LKDDFSNLFIKFRMRQPQQLQRRRRSRLTVSRVSLLQQVLAGNKLCLLVKGIPVGNLIAIVIQQVASMLNPVFEISMHLLII